ncbi:hypothetical protein MUG91_G4377n1 [Manis pentadactyla]|nr:hypothetical protein MUG91_G4377n1 [Manis pentadactyla]
MPDASGDIERTGECAIQFQDYSEAIVVSMLILEFQATASCLRYGMTDIEADGVGSALWKDLGSGSDMTGGKMVDQGYAEVSDTDASRARLELVALRKELGSGSYVTGRQDVGTGYGEAWVTSMFQVTPMLMLSVQVKGPWLVVGFSVRLSFMFMYGMTDIEADGVGSGGGQG